MAKEKTGKKLFIVESPTKVKTVKKYVSSDFIVEASVGHTHKLPTKNYVDIKNNFKLNYDPDPSKKDVLKKLVQAAKECDEIYLATDADVEGSVIARHLHEHLLKNGCSKKKFVRVFLKEITKSGIESALKSCFPIEDPTEANRVSAGYVRRFEDRQVGFGISPLANIYVKEHTSAGRVQSPALRLIVEREREIQAFVSKVYYEIFASLFPTGTKDIFQAKYTKEVLDEKTANIIVSQCQGKTPTISAINNKITKVSPRDPFVTKTLLSAGSTYLGWKTKRVTAVAQGLFQKGHITYIRTDNPVISADGQALLSDYLKNNFAPQYIAKTIPDYSNKEAKLEHECIRPTDLTSKPLLEQDEAKLYELIWCRFVAAGMTQAQYDSLSVDVAIGNHQFKATGSTIIFDGFSKVWNFGKKEDTILPPLKRETKLTLRDIFNERKETKPPSRYKGASLIEALDKMKIGKPSTMDSIIGLLEDRGYIEFDKNQSVVPTELGLRLNDFLSQYFLKVIDYDFTARVEEQQEKVMLGELKYEDVVKEFYYYLKEELKASNVQIAADKKDRETTVVTCPQCSKNLLNKKLNKKTGKFFYSCSGYEDKSCVATFSIGEDGSPIKEKEIVREILCDCPKEGCGGVLVKSFNSKTKEAFYACSEWKTGCKYSADKDGNIREPKKIKKLGLCPKCKKNDLVERTAKKTNIIFKACSGFPKCRFSAPIDKET